MKEIGEFTCDIVKEAGILLANLKETPLTATEKENHADLVTMADPMIEKFLVTRVLEKYPTHGILGEEGGLNGTVNEAETTWVIDPIDGTTNFIHGFPFYGISVAVVHKGIGIVGVVYNPMTNELFFAEKGKGLTINGVRVQMKQSLPLKEALISTTMFWADNEKRDAIHPSVIQLYKQTRGVRMLGGAAVTLSELAKGTFGAYYMPMLNAWDYAAGAVIVQEAGGVVTRLDGTPLDFTCHGGIIAAHPDIYGEVAKWFKPREANEQISENEK